MRCAWFLAFLLPGLASVGCGSDEVEVEDDTPLAEVLLPDGKADGVGATPWAITASSVQNLGGKLSSVRPAVRTADAGSAPEEYLDPYSALGPEGPLSAWGPLGALGPIGSGAWNVARSFTRVGASAK